MLTRLKQEMFITNNDFFEESVYEVFRFQAEHCAVYAQYLNFLKVNPDKVWQLHQIPFLPIRFFKTHDVLAEGMKAQHTFLSSSTTGTGQSRHLAADLSVYENSFTQGFDLFYGLPQQYCILALLPGYLERTGSSLVYMADKLIQQSGHADSGFYLNDFEGLAKVIRQNEANGQKTLLLGVSFALLDFAALYPMELTHTLIMETGGMKGRRKEITRKELHTELQTAFGPSAIHSEYGMTELFSQAYSKNEGRFFCPPWMRVLVRDADDPFNYAAIGKTGGINVIDLANLYSCSFIETEDLGRQYTDGSFEVLGRLDFSEVRGCNTMVV